MNVLFSRPLIESKSIHSLNRKSLTGFQKRTYIPLSNKQILQRENFNFLQNIAIKFLTENLDSIGCEQNESGFLRVSIPIEPSIKDDLGIEKIRLNFWDKNANLKISEESIHTHPQHFESIIISGGYIHEIYEVDEDMENSKEYQLYRIRKIRPMKAISYIGPSCLQYKGSQEFIEKDIVVIDTKMIHRVLKTFPDTLTINAVFPNVEKEIYYDVFLSENGTIDDVKNNRKILSNQKSRLSILKMINLLNSFSSKK